MNKNKNAQKKRVRLGQTLFLILERKDYFFSSFFISGLAMAVSAFIVVSAGAIAVVSTLVSVTVVAVESVVAVSCFFWHAAKVNTPATSNNADNFLIVNKNLDF
jgi:hypothetical protein